MLNVKSEIGRLRKVVLHRPGFELENLTPKWLNQLLFDDIPWLKKAAQEHDEFKEVLEQNGVEVLYLDQLVCESLLNDEIKLEFINQFLLESKVHNPKLKTKLKDFFLSLDTQTMVRAMIAGISKKDLPTYRINSLKGHIEDYPFICDPMPNMYFTRDPFSVIFNGVSVNKMYSNARGRETLFGHFIFNYHPEFKKVYKYYSRDFEPSIEGGDILVLSNDLIAIGVSERTDPDAIELLARRMFETTDLKKVLAIDMPKVRAFMHLDTILTQVDYDKFLVHRAFIEKMDIYEITPSSKKGFIKIEHHHDTLKRIFSKNLGRNIKMITCGGKDIIASDREQWNDGANTLAIAPGKVIVYERNTITNKLLVQEGIEVIPIHSSELSRGRGGPRCMSMPLYRDDI